MKPLSTMSSVVILLCFAATAASASGPRQSNDMNTFQGADADALSRAASSVVSGQFTTVRAALEHHANMAAGAASGGNTVAGGNTTVDASTEYPNTTVNFGPPDLAVGGAPEVLPGTAGVVLQDMVQFPLIGGAWVDQEFELTAPAEAALLERYFGVNAAREALCERYREILLRADTGYRCAGTTVGDLR